MGPRVCQDMMVKRLNPCPYWELNPSHPACRLFMKDYNVRVFSVPAVNIWCAVYRSCMDEFA
jgi:hypothetical protein